MVPNKKYDVNCFEEENIYLDEKICHHVVSIIALILIILIKIKVDSLIQISWAACFALATDALDNNPSLPTQSPTMYKLFAILASGLPANPPVEQ